MEGSVARARVGPHWALENLIIENVAIVVRMTLDGETQTDDVMPTQLFGNESKIMALEREVFPSTVRVTQTENFHTVDRGILRKWL